jgi:hypothetical protein
MPEKPPKPPPQPPPDAGHMPITEEMDSARWTLPPLVPLLVAFVAVAALVAIYSFVGKSKPTSAGAIREVVAAEQPDKASVLVLVRLVVENKGEKPFWVRGSRVQLKTAEGEWTDDAASAVDHDRYFQAFPELVPHRVPPLRVETRIPPGASQEGIVIVSFPVNKQAFDQRQSLTVTVDAYDQPSLILKQ